MANDGFNDPRWDAGGTDQYGRAPGPPPKKRHWFRNTVLVVGGLFVLIIILAVALGGNSNSPAPAAATSAVPTNPAKPAMTHSATKPSVAKPSAAKPVATKPALTSGQQQAIESAQSYLSDGQGFSQYGLMQQLTSSSGEGFPQADAAFAISYLHPDWYQQARESAQGYLQDGQGFSRSGLLEQLTSTSGEGFTQGQAEYAVRVTVGG